MSTLESRLLRQKDIIPFSTLKEPVTIVGAGAIGSWTALLLGKMGMQDICIYDYDSVELENMNSQFYKINNIGLSKVECLANNIFDFTSTNVVFRHEQFKTIEDSTKILISAVDSMSTRREIFEAFKISKANYFIDARMAAEIALMYTVTTSQKDLDMYEKTLYTDEEAVHERCTAKSTVYTANLIAGMICKTVKDILVKKPYVRVLQWDISSNHKQSFLRES